LFYLHHILADVTIYLKIFLYVMNININMYEQIDIIKAMTFIKPRYPYISILRFHKT
jgi:hypothetical protein